jgi:hypothetical protein
MVHVNQYVKEVTVQPVVLHKYVHNVELVIASQMEYVFLTHVILDVIYVDQIKYVFNV